MSKFIYCSECGMKLHIKKKALIGYGRIIDIVSPHICLSEPIELDLTPLEIPTQKDSEGKFVKSLNNLRPSKVNDVLQDRRENIDVKTSAPIAIIQQLKINQSTEPKHNLESFSNE